MSLKIQSGAKLKVKTNTGCVLVRCWSATDLHNSFDAPCYGFSMCVELYLRDEPHSFKRYFRSFDGGGEPVYHVGPKPPMMPLPS